MSLLNSATPYRRDGQRTVRVPVVMPLVEVTVDDHGVLSVMLDHEPYSADGELRRADLEQVLHDIATDLDTPIRVEIHETDADTFTDIVLPTDSRSNGQATSTATTRDEPAAPPSSRGPGRAMAADGFLPDEEIVVAVIVANRVAASDGSSTLRLPPALLESHAGKVMFFGRTSGTVVTPGGVA